MLKQNKLPIIDNTLVCPECGLSQPQINLTNCKNCAYDLGAPNVNIASTSDEINALNKRYNDAISILNDNGNIEALTKFETFFKANVAGVINTSIEVLSKWLVDINGAYKSYSRTVDEGLRIIASLQNDKKRVAIDGILFGSYGRDMIYAALALNNEGLISYGDCSVFLNNVSINKRASTLEENSYNFVKKHKISLERPEIPTGYMSTWENKHELVVAKLFNKLNVDCTEDDFCKIVLYNTGNRETDEYIEVFIYKEISDQAIKSIFIPRTNDVKILLQIKTMQNLYPGKIFIV